jgi:hypothetical protein
MADWLDEQLAVAPKAGAKGAAPSEGTSWLDEQLAAAPKAKKEAAEAAKPKVNTMDDMVQSAGSGIAKGVISRAGIFGDISRLIDLGPSYAIGKGAEWAGMVPQGTTEKWQKTYADAEKKDMENPTIMGRIEAAMGPTSGQLIKGVEGATGASAWLALRALLQKAQGKRPKSSGSIRLCRRSHASAARWFRLGCQNLSPLTQSAQNAKL